VKREKKEQSRAARPERQDSRAKRNERVACFKCQVSRTNDLKLETGNLILINTAIHIDMNNLSFADGFFIVRDAV